MSSSESAINVGRNGSENNKSSAPKDSRLPTRYLVSIIPPQHLPCDPPIPTNGSCIGYSTPDKFSRGTLIELMPTLTAQLSAVCKAYGLPSTGGLALFLSSSTSPNSGSAGPRISDEAWQILWGSLFEGDRSSGDKSEESAEDNNASAYSPKLSSAPLTSPVSGNSSPEMMNSSRSDSQLSSPSNRQLNPLHPNLSHGSPSQYPLPPAAKSISPQSRGSFGAAVIVGTLEFDIDRRENGRGKWYNNWIEGSTSVARIRSNSIKDRRIAGDLVTRSATGSSASDHNLPQELYLPSLVKLREEESAQQDNVGSKVEEGEAIQIARPYFAHNFAHDSTSTLPTIMSRSTSADQTTIMSVESSDESLPVHGYATLVDEEELVSHDADPLDDVFGTDESTWRTIAAEVGHDDTELEEDWSEKPERDVTGLGIVAENQIRELQSESKEEGIVEKMDNEKAEDLPPQDDVGDIQELLRPAYTLLRDDHLTSPIRLSFPDPKETTRKEDQAAAIPNLGAEEIRLPVKIVEKVRQHGSSLAPISITPQKTGIDHSGSADLSQDLSIPSSTLDPSLLSPILPGTTSPGDDRQSTIQLREGLEDLASALAALSAPLSSSTSLPTTRTSHVKSPPSLSKRSPFIYTHKSETSSPSLSSSSVWIATPTESSPVQIYKREDEIIEDKGQDDVDSFNTFSRTPFVVQPFDSPAPPSLSNSTYTPIPIIDAASFPEYRAEAEVERRGLVSPPLPPTPGSRGKLGGDPVQLPRLPDLPDGTSVVPSGAMDRPKSPSSGSKFSLKTLRSRKSETGSLKREKSVKSERSTSGDMSKESNGIFGGMFKKNKPDQLTSPTMPASPFVESETARGQFEFDGFPRRGALPATPTPAYSAYRNVASAPATPQEQRNTTNRPRGPSLLPLLRKSQGNDFERPSLASIVNNNGAGRGAKHDVTIDLSALLTQMQEIDFSNEDERDQFTPSTMSVASTDDHSSRIAASMTMAPGLNSTTPDPARKGDSLPRTQPSQALSNPSDPIGLRINGKYAEPSVM